MRLFLAMVESLTRLLKCLLLESGFGPTDFDLNESALDPEKSGS
jgi:hypothetical protein